MLSTSHADGKHATLAAAAILADGRVRVEIAGAWESTDEARAELPALLSTGSSRGPRMVPVHGPRRSRSRPPSAPGRVSTELGRRQG